MTSAVLRDLEAAILAHDLRRTSRSRARPTDGDISYARDGDVHTAYRTFGAGPVDVLLVNPGFIPIDAFLDEPHLAGSIGKLAEGRRVIAFDRRGIGLSDRDIGRPISVDDWVDDALAVLDACGARQPHVFANADGCLVALVLGARHPDRISSLTLVSPSVAGDPEYRAWWVRVGRRSASPRTAADLVAMMTAVDVRHLVPSIVTPTLMLVRRGCPSYDAGHGVYLAGIFPTQP
jgi:pimeloyl-ACP methyl ester carboxylesterase